MLVCKFTGFCCNTLIYASNDCVLIFSFFFPLQGLIHIRQIPRLNNLMCDVSDVKDLAFKLKRKLFIIEVREFLYFSLQF